jgi:hypothetical protein
MATNEQELFRVIGFDYTGRGLNEEESHIESPEQAKGEIEDLKRLAELFRSDPNMTLEDFFRCALEPYYDIEHERPIALWGHYVYRLSDHVPVAVRQKVKIYRSIYEGEGGLIDERGDSWETLESWRTGYWENITEGKIPEFIPQIPAATGALQRRLKSGQLT